jgi:hypothetical protein
VHNIDDYEKLKFATKNSLFKYVEHQTMKNVEIDADIKKEYEN